MTNKKWKLVWSDEFDYSGLPDPKKWNREVGRIRNQELQYYTENQRKNARVEDHRLIIEAHRENCEDAQYTSASLVTLGKQSWLYGRLEARAKLPSARGVWPAFWTLGENIESVDWPACGEIDILEFVGHEPSPTGIYGNIHYGKTTHHAFCKPRDLSNYDKKPSTEALQFHSKGFHLMPDATTAFHVYAVEWYPDHIDFFVDDQCYLTYSKSDSVDGSWPFDKPHYLTLNLAIGGNWGGEKGVDETAFPQRYEIDYVRVYQTINKS